VLLQTSRVDFLMVEGADLELDKAISSLVADALLIPRMRAASHGGA
jgi:hypothetical protein